MSAPDPPPDNSMAIRQMEIDEARRKEEKEAADKAARRQELQGLRDTARQGATGSVQSYFNSRGVDPSQYNSDIDRYLNNIAGSIDREDANPGQYFSNAGQNLYNELETGRRTRYGDEIDRMFGPNYDTRRIPFTLDDPYLSSIEQEHYTNADNIIRNMVDRGVLTGSGSEAARRDLNNQRAGVRTRLNEIGMGVLSGGQQRLRDIANNARETASTINLGQSFDPNAFQTDADSVFNEFIAGLGDSIRGGITGDLFTTSGLGAIGGSGQGAQNLAFDPNAVNGLDDDEDDDDTSGENIF